MPDLIERLMGISEFMDPSRPRIPTHEFEGHLVMFASGKWTAAEAQIGLDLQGDELRQMQQIVAVMNGKNATGKITYGLVVMSVAKALAHYPKLVNGIPEPVPNVYFSWDGNELVINRVKIFADLEIAG